MNDDRPVLLSSERPYDGRLVHLRVDRVRLPSGRETTREVIEHPGACVILPVTRDGQIWFVRQTRYAIDRELLELPAGLIDPGETPLETAQRELREEVGLVPGSIEEIGSLFPSAGYSTEEVHVFLARDCDVVDHETRDEGLTVEPLRIEQVKVLVDQLPFPFQNAATAFAVLWYVKHHYVTL
ncbi:MAG: NUDIX hydrolase [Thermomicrobiales bacterium]